MRAILDLTGLAERANDRTETFSGGMKRRLNIGIGLLHEPQLLVLDEPTVGVDPQSRNAILEAVEDLRQGGMSILYTTHYMEEAERLCDRIGIMDAGHVLAEGTRPELVATIGRAGPRAAHRQRQPARRGPGDRGARRRGVSQRRGRGPRDHGRRGPGRFCPASSPRPLEAGTDRRGVEVTEPDLEAVFLHLTGRALRD